jgi:hypothetical protein
VNAAQHDRLTEIPLCPRSFRESIRRTAAEKDFTVQAKLLAQDYQKKLNFTTIQAFGIGNNADLD